MHFISMASLDWIQLFGEGGAGAGDGGAAPAGQEAAAPAQPQKGVKNPLASVQYGLEEGAPDAGEPATPDRNARFEELIKGEYKDLYDQRVQDTIRKRLKGNEETVKKYNSLSPVLDLLAKKYGVDPSDAAALGKAIEEDDAYYEDEALETGLTVQQVKEKRKMLRENEQLRVQLEQQQMRENADRQYADWVRQGDALKQVYPSFDLKAEVQNEQFLSLLRSGVPLQTAFEVVHKDEILPAAMQFAARQAQQKVTDSIMAGQKRPAEGAMSNRATSVRKTDVTQLTRADREEIARRVARGEKIRF